MKTRFVVLIIIGVVIGGLILYGPLSNYIQNYNYKINKTEYLANQPTINVTGIIQYWQPIDGPSYSIIPEEDIDVDMDEYRGIFLYGKLSPSLEGKRVTVSGILIENYGDFQLKTLGGAFGGDPNTAVILVEQVFSFEPEPKKASNIEEFLIQYKIEYLPEKLVITSGPTTGGDPACGAAMDMNSTIHWFYVDSISNPKKFVLYDENPRPCKVNETSCFCNAQMKLTELTLEELSYFTVEEEEKYANILIDYLYKENINRTPKFLIGKLNLDFVDKNSVGYCGKFWGENSLGYFEGGFVDDVVRDFGLAKELPPLCAINEDSQYFGKLFGE